MPLLPSSLACLVALAGADFTSWPSNVQPKPPTIFYNGNMHLAEEEDECEGCGEDLQNSPGDEFSQQDVFNAVFRKAIVFNHPDNGTVYLYPSKGDWYLMRSNSRSGQPLGEGGKWHAEGDQLCIDTAIEFPAFAGCGTFTLLGGRDATWDHPFAVGLPITILELSEVPR